MFYSNYGDLFVGLSWENSRDLLQFGNRGQLGLWVNLPESGERETASIGIKDSIFLSKLDQLSINLRYRECLILALSHKKHWSASLGPSPGRSLPRLPRLGWAGVWWGFCARHKHGHTTSLYKDEGNFSVKLNAMIIISSRSCSKNFIYVLRIFFIFARRKWLIISHNLYRMMKIVNCDICSRSFNSKEVYNYHQKSKHLGEKVP